MENMYEKVMASVERIKDLAPGSVEFGIILGSGLGKLVDVIENKVTISYQDIPHFPESTVKGHEGCLVFGTIHGKSVVAMQGRFHYYEGYSMKEITYPVFVMKYLGVQNIVVTNACGGINKAFEPGTLMIIHDFINLVSDNPLIGVNDDRFGKRFPDMTEPFSLDLIAHAKETAKQMTIPYQEGVYASFQGPYYETAAEIRMIGKMGADAVGMSTVPETIVANYLGMKVLGISCITNMATGIQEVKHSHDRVVETANKASVNLCRWVEEVIKTY